MELPWQDAEFADLIIYEHMITKFKPFGTTEEELNELIKLGLKYDKRQKKQMLAASRGVKPNLKDVENFEAETGLIFPESYREFLLIHNGGIPDNSRISIPGHKARIIQSFYALTNPAKIYTIRYLVETYKDRIPKEMLPIANDPAGNLFLINAGSGRDYGKIYFWNHEQESDAETQPYYENIYFVSDSFSDFLNNLMR